MALEIFLLKPTKYVKYIADTFITWLHLENMQILHNACEFNKIFQFTTEYQLAFLYAQIAHTEYEL